jgi:hypothetical protein
MTDIERLEKTILDLHGYKGKHTGSVAVREVFQGQIIWDGVVEVFELDNHPQAQFAYGWSYKDDDGNTRDVAVLGVPPVESPASAVRAYFVEQAQKK